MNGKNSVYLISYTSSWVLVEKMNDINSYAPDVQPAMLLKNMHAKTSDDGELSNLNDMSLSSGLERHVRIDADETPYTCQQW